MDKLKKNEMRKKLANEFELGQRVAHDYEGVGHVESIETRYPPTIDVRWLTPNNEPSALVSCVMDIERLVPVADNVIPYPKSQEWWNEAREFCAAIQGAIAQMDLEDLDESV